MSVAANDLSTEPLNWLPAGAVVLDREFNLLWFNQSFAHFLARFAAGRRPLAEADPAAAWPEVWRILEPHVKRLQEDEAVDVETVNIRRGSQETYWDLILRPYPTPDNSDQLLLFMVEVTPHIRAYHGLERQMADRMRKIRALYEVMQVAAEAADLPTMVTRALQRVLAVVRAAVGMVHLLDENGRQLQLIAHHGLTEAMLVELNNTPADVGLMGQVLKQGTPVVVPHIQADENTRLVFRQSGLRAYAGVTMRVKGRVIGVLGAFWEGKRPLSPENVELLDSAADQIAVAIENHRLRQKEEQLAIVEERSRLAQDLHDSVSQALYSMTLLATAGRRLSRSGSNQALLDETLEDLGLTAQQALKEMRLLLYRLRPLALQFDGLAGALQHRLDAVEKRAGINVRLVASPLPDLPSAVEETLYHIAQEALNNALKHAAATAVTIHVSPEPGGKIKLTVTDNGQGFDLKTGLAQGGMGLANMQQRAASLGGTLTIESTPGQGTTVTISLPLGGES